MVLRHIVTTVLALFITLLADGGIRRALILMRANIGWLAIRDSRLLVSYATLRAAIVSLHTMTLATYWLHYYGQAIAGINMNIACYARMAKRMAASHTPLVVYTPLYITPRATHAIVVTYATLLLRHCQLLRHTPRTLSLVTLSSRHIGIWSPLLSVITWPILRLRDTSLSIRHIVSFTPFTVYAMRQREAREMAKR